MAAIAALAFASVGLDCGSSAQQTQPACHDGYAKQMASALDARPQQCGQPTQTSRVDARHLDAYYGGLLQAGCDALSSGVVRCVGESDTYVDTFVIVSGHTRLCEWAAKTHKKLQCGKGPTP